MSIMRLVAVLCDHGESCEAHEKVRPMATPEVARVMAQRAGWLCDSTGDWCPDHGPRREADDA